MTDAFAELVTPIFQRVIELENQLSWKQTASLDDVKRLTRSCIEAAEQRAVVDPTLAENFKFAKYGLVAWIDEILTDSAWGRSVEWGSEDHVLEWDMFHSRLRAEKFYSVAAEAEARRAYDVLETYLLCVALGFRGTLAYNEERFNGWIERVYGLISDASPVASKPFPDEADESASRGLNPLNGPGLLLRVSVLSAVTAVATLAAYLGAVHFTYGFIR